MAFYISFRETTLRSSKAEYHRYILFPSAPYLRAEWVYRKNQTAKIDSLVCKEHYHQRLYESCYRPLHNRLLAHRKETPLGAESRSSQGNSRSHLRSVYAWLDAFLLTAICDFNQTSIFLLYNVSITVQEVSLWQCKPYSGDTN